MFENKEHANSPGDLKNLSLGLESVVVKLANSGVWVYKSMGGGW